MRPMKKSNSLQDFTGTQDLIWQLSADDLRSSAYSGQLNHLKVEFGLIRENGNYRILGAGLLSAPDEMEYAMSDCPHKPDFDPKILAKIQFDDTTLQELLVCEAWN